MPVHFIAYYAGYYTHKVWLVVKETWIILLVAAMLIVSIVAVGERRSRKALENNPPTTATCWEDNMNCVRYEP